MHKIKEVISIDTIFGYEIIDRFKYLEDLNNKDTKNFVKEQNQRFKKFINSIKGKEILKKEIEELILQETISLPFRIGNRYFFYRRFKENHSILYYSDDTLDLMSKNIAIDPNKFSKDGTISLDFAVPSLDGSLIAFGKSKGGDENTKIFVLDLNKKKLMKDVIENAKWTSIVWDKNGFYYTRNEKKDGYKPVLYYHRLGENPENDKYIYGKDLPDGKFIEVSSSSDSKYIFMKIGEWTKEDVYFKNMDDEDFKPLFTGKDGTFQVDIFDDKIIFSTTYKAPKGALFITPIENYNEDNWKVVFKSDSEIIQYFGICGGSIVLLTKENTYSRVKIFDMDGNFKEEIKLPEKGTVYFSGKYDDDKMLISFESFSYPRSIFLYSLKNNSMEKIWSQKFDITDIEQKFIFVQSKDGKNIPVYIIHKKGIKEDGKNPVWLTGYGGFSLGISPHFSSTIIPWIKRGGIFVVAGIRGGNEYGEEWHKEGMREKKINVFNDFISVAEYLNRTYTSPDLLCISGGSNGGLLMGAMITKRPDLFKCVICSNPLLDMIKYHKFTVGYIWKEEYGDPDKEEDFKFLYSYSPYHNIKEDVEYPIILFWTSENDTRVHPAHALKMAARIMNINKKNPVYLYMERKTGHGGGKPVKMIIEDIVDNMLFMMFNVGMKIE